MALAAETLYTLQLLHLTRIALADADALTLGHIVAEVDNLVEEFGVCGERDVLLLDGGVDEGRLVLVTLAPAPVPAVALVLLPAADIFNCQVHTDALLQNQFRAGFSDAVTEMHQLAGSAGGNRGETLHAAEVLIVGILLELLNHLLVRDIAQVLQYEQADHHADGLGAATGHVAEQGGERLLEHLPVYHVGKNVQLMVHVQHALQIPEQGGALGGGFTLIHTQIYQFYTTKLQKLVDIAKFKMNYCSDNQIFNYNLRFD